MTRFTANSHAIFFRAPLLAAALLGLSVGAVAQGHPPGGGGPPGGGMGAMGGGMSRPFDTRTLPARPSSEVSNSDHGGLQLGPVGRWWDNKEFARYIGLNSLQQHRMDDVFNANRDTLLKLYKSLQHEESQLQKITRSRELDENQIFQQIDRVTAARGEVEKATAHMLLQIRKEMTPEQTSRLDEQLPALQPSQDE
jgi:Spy/CpxP family protein refolding chaperone